MSTFNITQLTLFRNIAQYQYKVSLVKANFTLVKIINPKLERHKNLVKTCNI